MKKLLLITIVGALAMSLTACSCSGESTAQEQTNIFTTFQESVTDELTDTVLDKTFSFGDIKFDINSKWEKTFVGDFVYIKINDTFKITAIKTDYNKSYISTDDVLDAYLINDETYTTEYTTDEHFVDGNKVVLFSQYKKGDKDNDEEFSRHFITACGDYSYNVYVSTANIGNNKSRCFTLFNEIFNTLKISSASVPDETTAKSPEPTTEKPTEKADNTPIEYQNALASAESYIKSSAFSKEGLREQLKYEKYTDTAVQYALDNVSADWNQEAVESAQSYLNSSSFSKQELYDQLIYEKFTADQAQYGVDQTYK